MKMGMSKNDILEYLRKDKEASTYLNNTLKKYRDEFYDFLEQLVELDIPADKNSFDYQRELQNFVLDLLVQRLRQLNCFGLPDKEYAKKVFQTTLNDIL
jgi:hypothetical protein